MPTSGIKYALSDISNWKLFVLIAILLRGPLWLYFGHLVNVNLPLEQKLYSNFVLDDYMYFFSPVDNFFRNGTFSYIGKIPFTGRMPGYSAVYFLFRLLCSPQPATYCVVGVQFILSSLSVYVLALTAFKIFESKRVFYITYCLYILAVFPGFFDFIIVAESFSVSALIFTLYYLIKYIKEGNHTSHLVLSGAFLTWTIFLREYTGLLIVIFPVALFLHHILIKKDSFIKAVKIGVLFCMPFIIADSAWIARNYKATGNFVPITSSDEDSYGKLYSQSWNAIDDLVYVWGENAAPFDPRGMSYYFREPADKGNYMFPAAIFKNVSTYNADSLIHLRQLYGIYYFAKDTAIEHASEKRILYLCAIYKNDYISHNHFAYYITKPLKDIKYLTFFSGTGYLPMPSFSGCSMLEKVIKLAFTALYFIILLCSFAGILLYIFIDNLKGLIPRIILISCLSIVAVIIIYCPIQEPRYSVHLFMMLVLFASYFINKVLPYRSKSAESK